MKDNPPRPLKFLRLLGLLGLALSGLLLLISPARSQTAAPDVPGWHGIEWGMTLEDVKEIFDEVRIVQKTKLEVGGCYFTYGVRLWLLGEEWSAWLCEDRAEPRIIAVNIERARFSANFDRFLVELTRAYGPAHRYWDCINAVGNRTVQYRWYFPTTTVTLLDRDTRVGWVMFRYERARTRPEFGPGVCLDPPIDLRREMPVTLMSQPEAKADGREPLPAGALTIRLNRSRGSQASPLHR